jgi:hypothetical protein
MFTSGLGPFGSILIRGEVRDECKCHTAVRSEINATADWLSTKHIDVQCQCLRDRYQRGGVSVEFVSTTGQRADMVTKQFSDTHCGATHHSVAQDPSHMMTDRATDCIDIYAFTSSISLKLCCVLSASVFSAAAQLKEFDVLSIYLLPRTMLSQLNILSHSNQDMLFPSRIAVPFLHCTITGLVHATCGR